jgi:hypothetical protein
MKHANQCLQDNQFTLPRVPSLPCYAASRKQGLVAYAILAIAGCSLAITLATMLSTSKGPQYAS